MLNTLSLILRTVLTQIPSDGVWLLMIIPDTHALWVAYGDSATDYVIAST